MKLSYIYFEGASNYSPLWASRLLGTAPNEGVQQGYPTPPTLFKATRKSQVDSGILFSVGIRLNSLLYADGQETKKISHSERCLYYVVPSKGYELLVSPKSKTMAFLSKYPIRTKTVSTIKP